MAKRKRVYRANPKGGFDDKMAVWIGQQIERVESSGGKWSVELFVELCRPSKSPGHKLFEWNIQRAAEAHWVERAQYILRHVEIEIVYEGDKQLMRAVHPVTFNEGDEPTRGCWASYDRVQSVPDLARQVVEKAAAELKSWRNRYALYRNVFGPVFEAITILEKQSWLPKPSTASAKTATRTAKRSAPQKKK